MTGDTKFEQLRTSLTKTFEELVKYRGNDPMIARIYSMIILSPEPLTQEQIAEKTGYSRSQISRYLSNLEDRRMITKESMPGSKTQLYGGDTMPFLDGFRLGMEAAEKFLENRVEIMNHILNEWKELPEKTRNKPESQKLKEVVTVFVAWLSSYLDLLAEFNQRFNDKVREIEKELLLKRY